LEEEPVFGDGTLRFLYHSHAGRWLAYELICRPIISRLYGWRQRRPASRRAIPAFARALRIDVDEADRPLEAYGSLDDFFTRTLKPGARPIEQDPNLLVAPCDGRLLVFPRLVTGRLPVKGCDVPLTELVQDPDQASRYANGSAAVFRLAPADYHRFHFFDDGHAGPPRPIVGPLHSVHQLALSGGAPSLLNQRVVTAQTTANFGETLWVEVGALCVGTVVQTSESGPVRRGQEKGYFRFGGSTVVLLWQRDRVQFDPDLVERTGAGLETLVTMGTAIGQRAVAPASSGDSTRKSK
jgi:phosphatidylserine decarboxylase